jgi:hypothetical protein
MGQALAFSPPLAPPGGQEPAPTVKAGREPPVDGQQISLGGSPVTTGPEEDRFIDIEFLGEVVQGGGGGPGPGLGAYVIGICAVDGVNPAAACA